MGDVRSFPKSHTTPVLAKAARTAAPTAVYKKTPGPFRGVRLYIDVDSITDTPSITVSIGVRAGDASSTEYVTVLSSAAIASTGQTILEVYPDGAAVANQRATFHIGRGFQVSVAHADSDSITYGIVGEWLI